MCEEHSQVSHTHAVAGGTVIWQPDLNSSEICCPPKMMSPVSEINTTAVHLGKG